MRIHNSKNKTVDYLERLRIQAVVIHWALKRTRVSKTRVEDDDTWAILEMDYPEFSKYVKGFAKEDAKWLVNLLTKEYLLDADADDFKIHCLDYPDSCAFLFCSETAGVSLSMSAVNNGFDEYEVRLVFVYQPPKPVEQYYWNPISAMFK